jgi:hypothetical protein
MSNHSLENAQGRALVRASEALGTIEPSSLRS